MSAASSTSLSSSQISSIVITPQTLAVVAQQLSRTNTPSPNNLIGEKRRWGGTFTETNNLAETSNVSISLSPIASRTRGSLMGIFLVVFFITFLHFIFSAATNQSNSNNSLQNQLHEMPRAVLTARRTKVRVLYHEQQNQTKKNHRLSLQLQILKQDNTNVFKAGGESPPLVSCLSNKRGRIAAQNHPFSKAGNSERPSLNFDKMREVNFLKCIV